MKLTCREYTLTRSYESSRIKGWIHGNTKIGRVLDVKICYHQKRYGVEIMIESLFGDKSASWVLDMSGSTNTSTKRQKQFQLKILETVVQGNLLRGQRRNRNRHRPTRLLMSREKSRTRSNKNLIGKCPDHE